VDVGDAPTPTPNSQAPTNPDLGGAQPPSNSTSMSTSMNIKSAPITSSEEVWRLIESAPYPSLDVLSEFPEGRQRLVVGGMVAFAAWNPEAPLIDYRPEDWPPEVWEEWGPAEVAAHLEPVIKRDFTAKVTLILACLLTQTSKDQLNIALTGVSASGKTHLGLIVTKLFLDGEVIRIAGTTPRALVYERGTLVVPADYGKGTQVVPADSDGGGDGGPPRLVPLEEALDPLLEELSELEGEGGRTAEARAKREALRRRIEKLKAQSIRLVDLEGKILVFLDQPSPELLERLRPLLSHDEKELRFTLTNKTSSGRTVTETAIIRGFPTVIFCTTKGYADEQERTRLIFLSPETSREKTREVLEFLADEASGAETPHPELEILRKRVRIVRNSGVREVRVEGLPVLAAFEPYATEAPSDTRFFQILLRLVKAFTLLNVLKRRRDESGALIAEPVDLEYALTIFSKIAESHRLGVTPLALRLLEAVKPALQGGAQLRRNELRKAFAKAHFPIDQAVLKDLLRQLVEAGLLVEATDPVDHRFRVYSLPPTGGQ
jgi:hypothetical protein